MTRDNIFESDCDAIVNTINCVGVMGGGLAKQFRLRYPDMNMAYQHACARGAVKIGEMWQWWEASENRWLIGFPTKDDWRNQSQLDYVFKGLTDLITVVADLKLASIAIPALGCGLGGLDWNLVEPLLVTWNNHVNARVDIYPPTGRKYTL